MTRRCLVLAAVAGVAPKPRGEILRAMQEVMGPLPRSRVALDVEVVSSTSADGVELRKIRYTPESGDRVPAWLFLPVGRKRDAAAVLCLHQTTKIGKDEPAGLGGNPDLHYARELAGRGFVAMAPDYPNFGEYAFDPYAHGYASATMKGIWNHMRALDVLEAQGARRIGVAGHSLGGHNALFLAAFDERARAVVTSCGFTAFAKYYGGDLTGWSHQGYMPRIATEFGKSPARMPFDFADVLRAIAPRPVFVNAPLRDANFEWTGVDDAVRDSGAGKSVTVVHPDAAHSFPPEVRVRAYEFLEGVLSRQV